MHNFLPLNLKRHKEYLTPAAQWVRHKEQKQGKQGCTYSQDIWISAWYSVSATSCLRNLQCIVKAALLHPFLDLYSSSHVKTFRITSN